MAYTMCQRGLNVVVPLWHHRPLIVIIIIYEGLGTNVRVGSRLLEEFRVSVGVHQGSVQ